MNTTTDSKAISFRDSETVSKGQWAKALLLGSTLALCADFASQAIPRVFLGMPLEGATFAFVGILKMVLGLAAVALGLRIVGLTFRDVGLVSTHLRSDILIGILIAVGYAVLQFLVVIPLTGGAEREDIVVESARIGKSVWGVSGFVVFAWTGVFYEELLFRGLLLASLLGLFRGSRTGKYLAVVVTALIFALLHGYQGWAGIIDAGLYGGLGLTLLYVSQGRLISCIVAHALWNTLATVGVYFWF